MISYMELLWVKRRFFKRVTTDRKDGKDGICDITIGSYGRHTLAFDGHDYFEWGHATIKFGKLYLKLHIVGRSKPVWLKIYDPNS